jgi:IS30 family transposase
MTYRQLSHGERYMLAALRGQGLNQSEIARSLGRHRSTVCREVRRNRTRADGRYRAFTAQERTNVRRSRSRRNRRFTAEDFALVDELLRRQWSPEQVAGHLRWTGQLSISHETIYRHVWWDKRAGGTLHTHLRGARKRRRKRYGAYDSRGRLAGKRLICERPPEVEARERVGHWEADTVAGSGSKDCVATLVERKIELVLIGELADRSAGALSRRLTRLIRGVDRVETVTADNATRRPLDDGDDIRGLFLDPTKVNSSSTSSVPASSGTGASAFLAWSRAWAELTQLATDRWLTESSRPMRRKPLPAR